MPELTEVHERVRKLTPLRFQALACLVARRVYGEPFYDIRDTQGEGNGCDAVRVRDDGLHGFQARTVENELGSGQKSKARSAVKLAQAKLPKTFLRDLRNFTFIFNCDLQPTEIGWFNGYAAKKKDRDSLIVDHHGLGWLVDHILRPDNQDVRSAFIQLEADRQGVLVETLAKFGSVLTAQSASIQQIHDVIAALEATVQALTDGATGQARAVKLLESARRLFVLGREHLDEGQYQRSALVLSEALTVLGPWEADPLYADLVYWRAMALFCGNRWKDAIEGFQEAAKRFEDAGRDIEAHYATGNIGNALFVLARHTEALGHFERVQRFWERQGDLRNQLVGRLNLSMVYIGLRQEYLALGHLEQFKRVVAGLNGAALVAVIDLLPNSLGSVAQVYFEMGRDREAVSAALEGVSIADKLGDLLAKAKLLAEAARMTGFAAPGEETYVRSLDLFERAESILKSDVEDAHVLEQLYFNRGLVKSLRNQESQALDDFAKSAEMCRALGDDTGLAQTLKQIERVRTALGHKGADE